MSIIQALKVYLTVQAQLPEGAPVWVNYLGLDLYSFSLDPMPGEKVITTYINDVEVREYPFVFRSMESTADELARIQVAEFYEEFGDWLEDQTESGTLPDLGEGKKPLSLLSDSWAFLYEQGQSETGVYQVRCKLTYEQQP